MLKKRRLLDKGESFLADSAGFQEVKIPCGFRREREKKK